MPPRDIRVRGLAALVASAAVLLTAVLAALAVLERIRTAFIRTAPDADALLGDVAVALLVAALAALLLAVAFALWIGRRLGTRLAELRAATLRLADGEPAGIAAGRIMEVQALAGAILRLAEAGTRKADTLHHDLQEVSALIDAVSEGIVQIGPDGRIVRANRAARALLGLPPGVVGQRIASVTRQAELRRFLEAAAAGGRAEPTELGVDGRRIFIAVQPMEEAGVVAVLVDLTELRRLEDVRRDFVINASHELKTPLTSIRGYAETLLEEDVPQEMRRLFLETIHHNSQRLQRIVDDLLDLSRIESGRWRPELEPLAVAHSAEEAWIACRRAAEDRQIRFEVVDPEDAVALADPVALGQVFSNLFDNAVRHTPPGGAITVRVSRAGPGRTPYDARARGGGAAADVVVEVRDTGVGIPIDALGRIFERFYRVDPARSRAGGGTGLGLAIVRHLVESMGGVVAAESELGRGTTIRFQLPAAGDADPAQ